MPEAVIAPTIVLGIEDLGQRVVARLEADARVLTAPPVRFLKTRRTDPVKELEELLRAAIDELTRTRLNQAARGRLDVVVVADLAAAGCAARARLAVETISRLVLEEFPAALPMRREPSQRSVCVVGLFAAQALVDVDSVRPVHEVELWHQAQPMSALARIHLLSRQHEGGGLTEEDIERGLYMFAASVWFSGLRDSEVINALVAHRSVEGIVCPFNAAAADVPVESVMRYFAWRSASVGLEVLHDRCAVPAEAGPSAEVGQLRIDQWISAFSTSDAARRAMGVGTKSIADSTEQHRAVFGWMESTSRVEAELASLLDPDGDAAEQVEGGRSGPGEPPQDVLVALDREERAQLSETVKQLDAFVETQLAPSEALKQLSGTLRALKDAREGLEGRLSGGATPSEGDPFVDLDVSNERAALRRAVESRPSPVQLVLSSLGLATLAVLLTIGIWFSLAAAPSAPAGPTTSQPVASGVTVTGSSKTTSTVQTWQLALLAALIGAMTGGGWFALRGRSAAVRLRDGVLELDRRLDQRAQRRSATGTDTAPEALTLRQRRLARAALGRLEAASLRVKGLRAAIMEARKRAQIELRSLGYREGTQGGGDASEVLGKVSALHRRLVAPESLERLWKETKETVELENWTRDLLEAAWPESGLAIDLPFPPGGDWETTTCVQEHRRLLQSSAFRWQEVQDEVAASVADFLARAVDPTVVGLPVEPTDHRFDPLEVNGQTEFLVIAPHEAKGAVESAKAAVRHSFVPNWGVTAVSRVVVVRTHPGCTSEQLAWGIQARERR